MRRFICTTTEEMVKQFLTASSVHDYLDCVFSQKNKEGVYIKYHTAPIMTQIEIAFMHSQYDNHPILLNNRIEQLHKYVQTTDTALQNKIEITLSIIDEILENYKIHSITNNNNDEFYKALTKDLQDKLPLEFNTYKEMTMFFKEKVFNLIRQNKHEYGYVDFKISLSASIKTSDIKVFADTKIFQGVGHQAFIGNGEGLSATFQVINKLEEHKQFQTYLLTFQLCNYLLYFKHFYNPKERALLLINKDKQIMSIKTSLLNIQAWLCADRYIIIDMLRKDFPTANGYFSQIVFQNNEFVRKNLSAVKFLKPYFVGLYSLSHEHIANVINKFADDESFMKYLTFTKNFNLFTKEDYVKEGDFLNYYIDEALILQVDAKFESYIKALKAPQAVNFEGLNLKELQSSFKNKTL